MGICSKKVFWVILLMLRLQSSTIKDDGYDEDDEDDDHNANTDSTRGHRGIDYKQWTIELEGTISHYNYTRTLRK